MSRLHTLVRSTLTLSVVMIGVMQMDALKTAAGGTSGTNGFADVTKLCI